jgi:elongation factor Ts
MSTLEKIKQLRSETGLSMTLIKEAVETYTTLEEARAYLQTLKIEDTHDMVAKKGSVKVMIKDDVAVLFEVNAMTDFVTSHQAFITFMETLSQVLLQNPLTPYEEIFNLPYDHRTVEEARIQLEMTISEHVKISRVEYVKKEANQVFGAYQHHNHRMATLIVTELGDVEHANLIAKHVAALGALHPVWKKTVIDQILQSTVFGKDITVFDYLSEVSATLLYASRYELGESMTEHLSCSLLKKEACSS